LSLVDNIAGKGFPLVPWLTLACSSVTTGVLPRICRVAIFWKHQMRRWQETLVNSLERASHPRNDHDRTALSQNPHLSRTHAMYDRAKDSWKAWAPAPWTDLMRRSAKKWREGRPRHRVTNAPLDTCQRSPDQGAGRDTASEALAAQACVDAFLEAHRNRLSQGSHLHLQPYTSRPPTATDHSGPRRWGPLWRWRPRFRVAAKLEIHPLDSRSQQDLLRSNHLSDTSAIEVRKRSLRDSFAGAFRHGEGGVGDLVASFLAATASSSARSFPLL
jgi:hypothetical protein